MKTIFALVVFFLVLIQVQAADFDALKAFGCIPERNIESALERARCENKRVLVATYDSKDDYNNQGLQIKYFTDLKETKRLLQENFVLALLDCNDQTLAKYSSGINLERPHYFLLSPDGEKLKDGTLCANPEDGLRRTKAIIYPIGYEPSVVFGSAPCGDLEEALKRAKKENKRVLVAVYDAKGDYNDQGLRIKYFTDLKETKQLLQENFIVVLLDRNDQALARYSSGINLERPHYFLLSPTGEKIKDDTIYANPEYGLRFIKQLIAQP